MSEQEKFAAQGKAHADLKRLRSEVATLKVSLMNDAEQMRNTAQLLSDLACRAVPDFSILRITIELNNRSRKEDITRRVEDLNDKSRMVDELQAQINQF